MSLGSSSRGTERRVNDSETGDPLPQVQRAGHLGKPVLQAFRECQAGYCSEKCS
jgi:hypothetical protein